MNQTYSIYFTTNKSLCFSYFWSILRLKILLAVTIKIYFRYNQLFDYILRRHLKDFKRVLVWYRNTDYDYFINIFKREIMFAIKNYHFCHFTNPISSASKLILYTEYKKLRKKHQNTKLFSVMSVCSLYSN